MKVFIAPTQWARANVNTIATLTTDILKVFWGKTRQLRSKEVVLGLIYEAADYHPLSAMVWNTRANARRMMIKDPDIMQQAKDLLKGREKREEQEFMDQQAKIETPGGASSDLPGIWPRPGLAGAAVEPDPSRPFGGGFR